LAILTVPKLCESQIVRSQIV